MLVAGIAQQLQVSAAVGAFLVGIALSGPLAHTARELLTPLRDLFAAVFFVFFGLQTDPADLPPVAGLAVAAGRGRHRAPSSPPAGWPPAGPASAATGRVRAGAALIPRGEFNIVIAGLAVAAGAHAGLGPLAAAYVLILAVIGTAGRPRRRTTAATPPYADRHLVGYPVCKATTTWPSVSTRRRSAQSMLTPIWL